MNANFLEVLEEKVPDAYKVLSDIVSLAKDNKEVAKLFAEPDVKNAALNLIAYAITTQQVSDAFVQADKDSQIKVANLAKTLSPVEDTLKIFSAKGAVYFEEVVKAFKPFMESYKGIVDANVGKLIKLIIEKSPKIKNKFSKTSPADIVALGNKIEEFAPHIGEVIKEQSNSLGNLMSDWMQKNAKPLFGLFANAIGAFKTMMTDIKLTIPGAQRAPTAEELKAQLAD